MVEKRYKGMHSQADGLMIDVLTVIPQDKRVEGLIQIVHGMCEYKERYLPFMEYLAERGIACIIHDQRGHGKSVKDNRDLGYLYQTGAEGMMEDIKMVGTELRSLYPELPFVLFGHSMGSLAVRVFAKKYDFMLDGLIVCGSPAYNRGLPAGKMAACLQEKLYGPRHRSKLLEMLSFLPYALAFPGEKNRFCWICSDPRIVSFYEKSPVCGFTFTVDAYKTLFQLMSETYSRKGWMRKKTDLPILFLGGEKDPCIGGRKNFSRAMGHMRSCGYGFVWGKLYKKMRHEILNEFNKEEVFEDIYKFIKKIGCRKG